MKLRKIVTTLVLASLLLGGCTGLKSTNDRMTEQSVGATEGQTAEAGSTEATGHVAGQDGKTDEPEVLYSVEEVAFPDPISRIDLREGEKCWYYDVFQAGDMVACSDRGYSGNYENWYFYTQIYDSTAGEWVTFDATNNNYKAEVDGVTYYGMQNVYRSLDDKLYTNAYIPDVEGYLCETDQNGFRHILYAIPETEQEIDGDYEWFLDKEKRLYLYSAEEKTVRCYDAEGTLSRTVEVPGTVYGIMQGNAGEDVYWYGTNLKLRPVIGSLSTGEITAEDNLEELASDYKAVMAGDGTVYLADTQNLFRLTDGTLRKVFGFVKNGYIMSFMYDMGQTEEGSLSLLVEMDNCITRLSMTEVDFLPEKKEIIYADLVGNAALAKSIARFNRRSEKYHITLQLPESIDDRASFSQEVQIALGTGKGPDLIGNALLTDIDGYVEKGYLAEVGDIVGESSLYVNGALDTCRVNGILYGIPYDCSFDLVAYSKDTVGDRQTLSLQDFVGLVEKSGAEIVQENVGGTGIILNYVLADEKNTAYIDWKNGKCDLSSPDFLKILEFAKKYADTGRAEKDAFAYMTFMGFDELRRVKEIFSYFDGKASLIGYPKENGNGIYVSTDSIYLRAGSEAAEGAKEFLRFLISEEEQEKYASYNFAQSQDDGMSTTMLAKEGAFPVVKSAYKGMIRAAEERDADNVRYLGELPYTEDMVGQIYYIIDHAEPRNAYINQLEGMVEEELEPYFAGDISAEEAAEKLQNRVQLYLNEK